MDEALALILKHCVALDGAAGAIYHQFAEDEKDPKLQAFWRQMSLEEHDHLEYWNTLLAMAKDDMVPQVFDDPVSVLGELQVVLSKVQSLSQRAPKLTTAHERFLAAFWLEFYVLHPGLEQLLYLLREITGKDPEGDYERHINGFLDAVAACDELTPDLELLASMIRRLWRQYRKFQKYSHIDPTTGLRNRRGLHEAMVLLAHLARRRDEPVGVLVADIDHFKAVNDAHGHPAGDKVLRAVGGVLDALVRESDVTGRTGGDEFLVFLPIVAPAFVREIAERARKAIEEAPCAGQRITVSIGACHAKLGDDVDAALEKLIQRADAALLEAKQRGRNTIVVYGEDAAEPGCVRA